MVIFHFYVAKNTLNVFWRDQCSNNISSHNNQIISQASMFANTMKSKCVKLYLGILTYREALEMYLSKRWCGDSKEAHK